MIELKQVVKKFDKIPVLDSIDLTIEKGTAYGLLGSNGAGKSTILRLISGIYNQEEGQVLVDGKTVFDNNDTKKKIFFINDETIQFSKYTLLELKDFYKKFYSNFSEKIFENLIETIKLPLNKKIRTFSKGMKRQAIVAIALSCQTEYLLLDEAFDGLDPTMRIIVKKILVDAMIDRELTVVISSHNLKEINELCDTVALLHKGKMVFSRNLDDIKSNIHKIQVAFSNEYNKNIYSKDDFNGLDILHFEKNESIYHLIIKGDISIIKKEIMKKKPLILDILPLTLEEIFIYEMEGLGYEYHPIVK